MWLFSHCDLKEMLNRNQGSISRVSPQNTQLPPQQHIVIIM